MKIEIKKSPAHGRGVFATQNIGIHELIEQCPMLSLPETDAEHIKKTKLNDYYFEWGTNKIAIALGFGSLYNHSYTPNAIVKPNLKKSLLLIESEKFIKKGEEIFINYYSAAKPGDKVWFDKYIK